MGNIDEDNEKSTMNHRCTVILLRHGVTAWNRDRRFQGQIDTPLSEEGLKQAVLAAARLRGEPVAALYSSDLQRCMQTAQPIATALGLPIEQEPGLRERSYGIFEGRTFDEIQRDLSEPYQRWRAREPDYELPGGEVLRHFHGRVQAALDRLVSRHAGQTIVAVTHGGVLDSVYRIASGLAMDAPRQHDLFNASLNHIAWQDGRYHLLGWGDVAHLRASLDDVEARD